MNLHEIKETVNLVDYAHRYHDLDCNRQGKAHCPFHKPDKNPSFIIYFKEGSWAWIDEHDKSGGTIVEFEAKFANCSTKEAKENLLSLFKNGMPYRPVTTSKTASSKATVVKTIPYFYKDADGVVILKKEKKILSNGNKNYCWQNKVDDRWSFGKGEYSFVPYNLDQFKDYQQVIIAEGEKDADTINSLNIGEFATSAPNGAGSWPDEITPYFKDFKRITFLYDVGTDGTVKKHAENLKEFYPKTEVCIATIPMDEKNADITDYLDTCGDKQTAFLDVLVKEKPVQLDPRKEASIFTSTLEDLILKDIPEVENLIKPYVFRGGLTEVGGVKGSHKSFFVANMAFYYASGISPFLTATIEKPGTVLIIQQEITLAFNKKRLMKMRMSGNFFTENRLHPYTTTAQQLKLTEPKDLDKLKRWIEEVEPDILILDPLNTFHLSEENRAKDMSKLMGLLSELKATYNLGLVFSHHFSSKRNPNDPNAPSEAGGWFRGHSSISDAADVLICLHRLPGQHENPNLPKDYQDYNLVEISLRNERNPKRFAIEFNEETFFLEESTIWQELGKLILPGQITDLIDDNNGEMLQCDIVKHFKDKTSRTTVRRAIEESLNQGLISKEILAKPGKPVLLRQRK